MPLGKWLDYSQARPPLGKVKSNGYGGVYRYVCSDLSEQGLPGKRLTPAERDQILTAGLDLGLHGEDEAGASRAGYARGREQGKQWAGYAHDVLGAPAGMTIVAAIDYDTAGTYPPVVADYLHGVRDGLNGQFELGVYGSIYVVDAALAEHTAVHGVQTVAWSHGKVSSWANLYQHGGSEFPGTDYNDVFRVPHGTWLQTLGDPVTQDEINAIAQQVLAVCRPVWRADIIEQVQKCGLATQSTLVGVDNDVKSTAATTQGLIKQAPTLSGTWTMTGQGTLSEQTPPVTP
jgi:hypothetical protein